MEENKKVNPGMSAVKVALVDLINENYLYEPEFLSCKYVTWQLSKIFTFPINFYYSEEDNDFICKFTYDGYESIFHLDIKGNNLLL